MRMRKIIPLVIFLIYFSLGLITLSDYGHNWDEPVHFMRGQAFLHYFLTGKKDYNDLPEFEHYYQKDDTIFFQPLNKDRKEVARRSTYQYKGHAFNYWLKDTGHPPLSGIFASFFNFIFFQKLGLINDVDSYHLYSIFLAAILVGAVFWWVRKIYGVFAGLVASLSLALYPLFLGESHFNIKDVPETVFYSLTIITFYEGITKRKNLWLILSSVFCGFALATKFNILFVLFILVPWALIHLRASKRSLKYYFSLVSSMIAYPIIAILIFFVSWPTFWSQPIKNLLTVVSYYREIGINPNFDPRFLTYFNLNTYASQWILFTSPLVILFFSVLGIVIATFRFRHEGQHPSLLILLWFFIPILRVTMPQAGIYGGVRQIMEYIPAMAILAGIGANYFARNKKLLKVLIILMFIPITLKMIQIHPNQGVFFSPLIGGLKGAKEKNLTGWGESLGGVNRQGLVWLNRNVEKDAKLATNFGLGSSINTLSLRDDIQFSNAFRSVLERKGEYIIGLTHQSGFEDTYFFKYLERFLLPVYEVKIDGVAILKIWKNDLEHTRKKYREIQLLANKPAVSVVEQTAMIDLGKTSSLAKIVIHFTKENCQKEEEGGMVQISQSGQTWQRLDGDLRAQSFLTKAAFRDNNQFIYYFAEEKARYIQIQFNSEDRNSCFRSIGQVEVYGFLP